MRPRLVFCLSPIVLLLTGCFPHHAGPRLAHFEDEAPAVGDPAPEFTLYDLDGNAVELSSLIGVKPIVLRFGSHSCPVYRYRRFSMEGVIEDYDDRVHFLTIYTREAHPVDSKSPYAEGEWDFWLNRVLGVRVHEPATERERAELASASHEKLNLPELMVVDDMDNSTWEAYGSASSPAFVIDRDGKVALRQVWVIPKEIREVLDELLDLQAEPIPRDP